MDFKMHKVLLFFVSIGSETFGNIPFFLMSNPRNLTMNSLIQPDPMTLCLNFYGYSCSKWIDQTIKPDYEPSWNHFTAASYKIKKNIQHILESPLDDDYFLLQQTRQFYEACIRFEDHGDQYLRDLKTLIKTLKGWPIIEESWSTNSYSWLEEVALITRKLGFHPLIKFHVGIDYKDTDNYVLYIEPGSLVFPQNILLNTSQFIRELSAYREWIMQTIQYLYPENSTERNLKDEVQDLVDFERKLAKLMTPKSRLERRTMESFSRKFNYDFSRIFHILFSGLGIEVKSQNVIAVRNYGYIKNLMMLMERMNSRKVANYLIWAVIKEFSRDTTARLKKLNFSIDKAVLGIASDIDRKIECTNKATDYFSYAILPRYLKSFHKNNVIKPIREMANNIKTEYVNLLKQNTWLSNETKVLAIDKVQNIECIVGYSEWMKNGTELKQYYNKLAITNNHFKNLIAVKELKIAKNLLLLGKAVKAPLWPSNIFDVNAYYSILQNLVFVPIGILQEPFYNEQGPRILNYGALGSLIGHEFSHSLDTSGKQANSNGKIVKWWPKEDTFEYQLKSKCFKGAKHQPTDLLLIGENIADNVGLDLSYRAYKKLNNIKLEDFFWDFQDDKIFFFSYAQMWCEVSAQPDLFGDEHTSVEVRVNQAVTNNQHFNEIFNCTEKQFQKNVCKLW